MMEFGFICRVFVWVVLVVCVAGVSPSWGGASSRPIAHHTTASRSFSHPTWAKVRRARPLCVIGKKASFFTKADQRLSSLFKDFWSWMLCEDPLLAAEWGERRYAAWLPEVSEAAVLRRGAGYRVWLKRLAKIQGLSKKAQIQAEIFRLLLNNWLGEIHHKSYFVPMNQRESFASEFAEMMERERFSKPRDALSALSRLHDFGRYTDEHIVLMRKGASLGYTLPRIVSKGIDKGLALYLQKDVKKSSFYRPFLHLPKRWPLAQRRAFQQQAEKEIQRVVMPSYKRFLSFWRTEYLPKLRNSIAVSALPLGRAFYRHRIRYYTTLSLTAEEIHQRGLSEVARIRKEMLAILKKLKFQGDFAAFLHFLRTDARFYVKTPEQLLKEVSYVLKRMDGQLPKLFGRLPRTPYGIREIPLSIAPRTTPAFYWPLSGDGREAGYYYVNTYNLKSRPLYEIEALSFHEAVPGHHLQIALQQEQGALPMFRRAFRFTVFVEGWALYAERLGLEVGFYQDPYRNFGRLTYEMWRACRLVVDTGMHAKGWSRQRSIDFMARHTALSLHNIQTEVDRYIAWPGQALAYKMGELAIRGLRKKAETALGSRFSIRRFHDVVLQNGSVPLPVLSQQVQAWIAQERRASSRPATLPKKRP